MVERKTPDFVRRGLAGALGIAVALALVIGLTLSRREAPSPDDAAIARAETLVSEAEKLRELGSPDALRSAVPVFLEAIALSRDAGARRLEIASRLSLGDVHEDLGDVDAAVAEYEEANEVARDAEDDRLVARSANRLSAMRHRLGDVDAAKRLAEEALSAARRASSDAEESDALFNIGLRLYSLGAMRASVERFEGSARAARSAQDLVLEARARLHVGMTAMMMEQKDRALSALTSAVALSREAGDPGSESEALRALGQLQSRLGESQSALENLERARRLLEPLGDRGREGVLLNSLGQVYFDLGETETALRHYRGALAVNEALQFRRREAATLLEVGRCELDLGREQEALHAFTRALAIYRGMENRRLEADALAELGRFYERTGKFDAAVRHFDEALALKLRTGDSRGRARTLDEAGTLHARLGDYETALACYREAAELSRADDDPIGESLALYHAGRALRELGRPGEARTSIERSLDLVESLRARVASYGLRTSFSASVHERYSLYVSVLLQLEAVRPGGGLDALAFQVAERARARTLLESLGEAAAGIREGIEPELLDEERSLRERLNEAALERSLLPAEADPETARALSSEIASLATDYDRLQSTIRTRSPRYSSLTQPQALAVAEIQRSILDEGTRLLAYSLGAEESFLWSVTRADHHVYELPTAAAIEELASRARSELTSPRGTGGGAVEELSRMLLGPVAGVTESERLLVVSEGALNRIPFAALRDGNGAPLVKSLEIVRLPSASIVPVLRRQRDGRTFTKWAAVAADPAYGRQGGSRARGAQLDLRRLASSREEALAIQALAPPGAVDVVLGPAASREWVTTTDFRDYRALHFATHGIVDDREPAVSGVVLSLVDERGDARDGFLRLHDVYNLDLPVDLVVLSACETGLGKDVRGEGLLGLVRGFLYAGAAAVVASAWNVDDEATSELMKHFYRSYFAGSTPAAALRRAQNALLETRRFAAPYYWAAFELQGDWR